MLRLLALLVFSALLMPAQRLPSPSDWKTDLSKKSIDLAEILPGGPPKDGIPAINNPEFVGVDEASKWLSPNEPVLVVNHGGEVRAYPLQILIWHELTNDRIGDLPILVSFCPLCNSAIVFDRRVDGKVYDFGVTGMLRHSDMVMFDRQTESFWQQLTGEAIVGALTGKRLEIVSSQVAPFHALRESFPAAKVQSKNTGHDRPYGQSPYVGYEFGTRLNFPVQLNERLPVKMLERLVTISIDSKIKAHPLSSLRRSKFREGKINDTRYVIFFEPDAVSTQDAPQIAKSKDVGAVNVFSPEIDGKLLKFRRKKGKIIDKETGSVWSFFGKAIAGPLAGKQLEPIEHGVYYAFAWMVFHPDTEIVGAAALDTSLSGVSGPVGGPPRGPGAPAPGAPAPGGSSFPRVGLP